jgi:hypothetical protein
MTIGVSDLCVQKSTGEPNRAYVGNQRRQEAFRTPPPASDGIGSPAVPPRPGRRAAPIWALTTKMGVSVVVFERFWLGLNPRGVVGGRSANGAVRRMYLAFLSEGPGERAW